MNSKVTHDDGVTLAERIRRAVAAQLVQQGISQRELARRLGWSQPYVWRRLAGRLELSLTDLDQIASALGLPVTALVPAEHAVAVHHRHRVDVGRHHHPPADSDPGVQPHPGVHTST